MSKYSNQVHAFEPNPIIYKDLNNYQRKIVTVFENISKRGFGSASWTVVEPYCHFTK